MKDHRLQPVNRHATPRAGARSPSDSDRPGWLRRIGSHLVERKLDTAMQGLVRQEKYASALIVSFRIARELDEPLRNLGRHIATLERLAQLAQEEPEFRQVLAGLRRDRQAILSAVRRLAEIQPPTETAA